MLIRASNHSMTGGTRGFIQIDLLDKSTFDSFRESCKTGAFSRYDICVNHRGGRVFQKVLYGLRTANGTGEFVDVISWNLESPHQSSSAGLPCLEDVRAGGTGALKATAFVMVGVCFRS
jgi:hypothetical protein